MKVGVQVFFGAAAFASEAGNSGFLERESLNLTTSRQGKNPRTKV